MIIVCGAGTVGGTLVEHLARLGHEPLAVIDHDAVEGRNLANQPYFKRDAGQPKVRALADLVYRIRGAQLRAHHKRLTQATVTELLAGATLVVDAFDNRDSRLLLKQHCAQHRIPCLHVGLSLEGYAEVFWNDFYNVPPDQARDACADPSSRTLTLLAVSAASEAIAAFVKTGRRRSFTITAKDLRIAELTTV